MSILSPKAVLRIRVLSALCLSALVPLPLPVQAQENVTAAVRLLTGHVQTEAALRFVPAASGDGDRQVRLGSTPYVGTQLQLGVPQLPLIVQLGVARTVQGNLQYEDFRQVTCGDNCTRTESTFASGGAATSTWWTGMLLARSPDLGRLHMFAGVGGGQQRLTYDKSDMPAHVLSAFPSAESSSFRSVMLGVGVNVVPKIVVNADVARVRSGFWFEEAAQSEARSALRPQADMQYSVGVTIRLF